MLPARVRFTIALGLLALATSGAREDDAPPDGGKLRSDVRTVSGTISAFAWAEGKLTIAAADGPVTLGIDRNTTVFLESRLGSPRDLVVGAPVRASFGGDQRAVWVEVRQRAAAPSLQADEASDAGTRDAGTGAGPPHLPMPPGDGGTPGGEPPTAPPDAGAPSPPPERVPAGPSPPEPNPGVTPPRPRPPGPSGPGRVPGGAE